LLILWRDHITNDEVMTRSGQLALQNTVATRPAEDDLLVTFRDSRQPDQLVWLWNGLQKSKLVKFYRS